MKAQALSWRENSAKALIVIGDALPHQAAYTDRDISWREELATLTDMGVKVYGVQVMRGTKSNFLGTCVLPDGVLFKSK